MIAYGVVRHMAGVQSIQKRDDLNSVQNFNNGFRVKGLQINARAK